MIVARRKEQEYFATSPDYGHLAHKMGSEYLAKLLSNVKIYPFPFISVFPMRLQVKSWIFLLPFMIQHLESVIRARIPSIIALINKTIAELEAELDRFGRPIGSDAGVKLRKCCFFSMCSNLVWVSYFFLLVPGTTLHHIRNVPCIWPSL